MTMKHAIAFSLTLTVVLAIPPRASAQFDLDLQATEIGTQLQEILNRVTQYTAHCSLNSPASTVQRRAWQPAHEATPINEAAVVCDTLNMIGAFRDSYPQLLAVPTDLLNTPAPLPDWRDVLGAADTVTEADIRNRLPGQRRSQRWPSFSAGATTPIAASSWHMRGPMPRPHLRMLWTRPRPLLRILKHATASPARLLHKLRWLPRSLGRAYSSRFLTFALTRQPPRRRMPTTQKWRGGRSSRGGWRIAPLLKRSGPRNRQP